MAEQKAGSAGGKEVDPIEQARLAEEEATRTLAEARKRHRELLSEKAQEAITGATEVFRQYSQFITQPQVNRLAQAINATIDLNEEDDGDGTRAKPIRAKRAAGDIKPKFSVSGKDWSGRGITPKEFEAWDKSDEGKKWRKENPKQQYPFHKDYTPTEKDLNWKPLTPAQKAEAKAKREAAKAAKNKQK